MLSSEQIANIPDTEETPTLASSEDSQQQQSSLEGNPATTGDDSPDGGVGENPEGGEEGEGATTTAAGTTFDAPMATTLLAEESVVVPVAAAAVTAAVADNGESVKHLTFIDVQEREFQEQVARASILTKEELLDRTKASPLYLKNSRKEELCLEYVHNFRRQYAQLYPGRKELLLCPPNEFGVPVRSSP